MTKISILGCGWLGLPLAKVLLGKGFTIKGSTTSAEKISLLENFGIHPFLIALSADKTIDNATAFLNESEILIIDIPPKLRDGENNSFVAKIESLIPYIEKSTVKSVLFISSTSVYGEQNTLITEATKPNPDTESGKQLIETEMLLQNNSNFTTTILRFGGLIGKDRHPIHFLSGRKKIENPDAPVNLIHQEDCIGIILKIIEMKSWDEIFNAVTPYHPTRKKYHTEKALELKLPLPEFIDGKSAVGKTVLSNKIQDVLKYDFVKPNL